MVRKELGGSQVLKVGRLGNGNLSSLPIACYPVFMANTRSATLSIRLKPATKRRLARLAEASGRSSNFLISDAVESYVTDQERVLAEMRQADVSTEISCVKLNRLRRELFEPLGSQQQLRNPRVPRHDHLQARRKIDVRIRRKIFGGLHHALSLGR